jgi:hypothetical protein
MMQAVKLGGIKLFKDAVCFTLTRKRGTEEHLLELCRDIAEEKINLSLFAFGVNGSLWWANLVAGGHVERSLSPLLHRLFEGGYRRTGCAVLSLFPHRNNPEVAGTLLNVLTESSLPFTGLACSSSAMSIIVNQEELDQATLALFTGFHFGPYRSPTDWKSAQEGKEELYKEVVASYQERRPKVYGLEWRDGQSFQAMTLTGEDLKEVSAVLQEWAGKGLALPFIISGPGEESGRTYLSLCLPAHPPFEDTARRLLPGIPSQHPPVAIFTLNGPHFSDRYGIVSDLLLALFRARVGLLALSCAVSSISGVVLSEQIHLTTKIIQECFEVPGVIRRE